MAQLSEKTRRFPRWRHATAQNIATANRPAIVSRVGILLRGDHRAFERGPGKQAFAAAIRVDGRNRGHPRLQVPSDRARSRAHIRTECDVSILGERAHGVAVIQNEDKLCHLRADLKAETCAASSDEDGPDHSPPLRATTTP